MSISVVLASDDRFAIGAGVLAHSVLRSTHEPVRFVYLQSEVSDQKLSLIQETVAARPDCELRVVDVAREIARLPHPQRSELFNRMTFARVLTPEIVAGPRAIYLDADTLVLDDIGKLHRQELAGAPLAAVPDYAAARLSLRSRKQRDYFRGITQGRPLESYFNAGVLVMDLDAFRRENLTERVLSLIYSGRGLQFADQCALNVALEGRFQPLAERWNVLASHHEMPRDPLVPATLRERVSGTYRDPGILHYAGQKPWTPFPVAFKKAYRSRLEETRWGEHRQGVASLSWKQKQQLIKSWRNQVVSLRMGRRELAVRLFGRKVVHLCSAPAQHAA